MYKTQKVVVEDVCVSNSCPSSKKIFTGGASVLELPLTVSFMDEGEYRVRISNSSIIVEKISC